MNLMNWGVSMTFRFPNRCKHCREKFTTEELARRLRLHISCIDGYADAQAAKAERAEAKKARAAAKVERAETKKRLRELRPIREFLADAQAAFNAWVRARDEGLPCISCGELHPHELGPGGAWDAGHFLSRGAHPEKRFMEDNVHRQCKVCNGGSAKNPAKALTVSQRYAIELQHRIGPERYGKLLEPIPVTKWTREQLTEIAATYRAKSKALKSNSKPEGQA